MISHQNKSVCYGFLGETPVTLTPLLKEEQKALFDASKKQCGVVFGNTHLLHIIESESEQKNAFLSWSNKQKTLEVKRNFHGLSTLFYFENESTVYFSSSLKVLLKITDHIPKKIFINALSELCLLGRIAAPYTLYQDVKHLYPGQIKTWQLIEHRIHAYDSEIKVTHDVKKQLSGSFITGDQVDAICSPFSAEVKENLNDNIAKVVEELSTPSDIEIFKELPRISSTIFEPAADIGILLYSEILKKRINNISWNFVADLLGNTPVFEERLSYLKSITRRKYKRSFSSYWREERFPELLRQTKNIRLAYDELTEHTLSEESLVRLATIAPERLRNMYMLQQLYTPNTQFHVDVCNKEPFQIGNFKSSLELSFFSDKAMEAGNLFSQFTITELIAPTLDGTKFSTIFSLSPLEKRWKLIKISSQSSLHLERCLCGVMSADFLWRFYV